jgi:hypothetical protein
MPYEYEVFAHSVKTMSKENLKEWLALMGAQGWQLVSYHPDIETPIIFMREIEINEALRKIQLQIDEEKAKHDKREKPE